MKLELFKDGKRISQYIGNVDNFLFYVNNKCIIEGNDLDFWNSVEEKLKKKRRSKKKINT